MESGQSYRLSCFKGINRWPVMEKELPYPHPYSTSVWFQWEHNQHLNPGADNSLHPSVPTAVQKPGRAAIQPETMKEFCLSTWNAGSWATDGCVPQLPPMQQWVSVQALQLLCSILSAHPPHVTALHTLLNSTCSNPCSCKVRLPS